MVDFDYIVVGGGTAGCVLAARLSQDPDARVLLLEAGADTPAVDMRDPVAFFSLQGSSVDWSYRTIPQRETEHAVHFWPRGKVLGGSSGINGMMHFRGDRSSYDAWEAAGASGWNYDALLPFFKRSERAVDGDPAYRGLDGPMQVAPAPAQDPLWEAAFEAAVQAGHDDTEDSNGATATGTSWHESNVVNGARQSAADGYLAPIAERPNLTVVADAHVRRLLVKRNRCEGVEYLKDGQTHTSFAAREVVLSAGTIGTPQLLLLSGIGPGQHLRDVGIEVVADLPGVGANLHDHPKSQVSYATTAAVGTGHYARKPQVLMRSEPTVAPDLHAIFLDFPVHPRFELGQEPGYSVIFALMTPCSRGSVRLASADPDDAPCIDRGYLTDRSDIARLTLGLHAAREIGSAPAFASVRDRELFPGIETRSDTACHAYLRRTVSTYFHPVGTCAIGTNGTSVVDAALRVHGIKHLRVADASVMPSIVSGNTNAAVLAIAERAATLISGSPVVL